MVSPGFSGAPSRYLASLGLDALLRMVGICAITCGIYMIERTVGILEIALHYRFSTGRFLSLVALQLPTLAEFALPVAAYAAVHFVLLGRRERREFVSLVAAGVQTKMLVAPLVTVGATAALLSVAFTDVVAPAATRAYRNIETEARAQVLANRLPETRFFVEDNEVLYVGTAGASGSTVRLFQRTEGQLASILSSDCASPDTSGGRIRLRLCDGYAYLFNRPIESGAKPTHVKMGETIYAFDVGTVLGARSGSRPPTLSVRQLLFGTDGSQGDVAEGLSRLLSAIACLLASSLAIVTVAFTSPGTRVFTVVVGSLSMFALMALREPLAYALSGFGTLVPTLLFAALATAGFLLPKRLANLLERRLIAPVMTKT